MNDLTTDVVLWLAAAAMVIRSSLSDGGASLRAQFVIYMALLHLMSALVHLLGVASGEVFLNPLLVAGFRLSTLGMVSFAAASFLVLRKRPVIFARWDHPDLPRRLFDGAISTKAIIWGGGCAFVLLPAIGPLPSLTAILSAGSNLLVMGLALRLTHLHEVGRRRAFYGWVGLLLVLPFVTAALGGFMGLGAFMALSVLVVFSHLSRVSRRSLLVAALVGTYLGLSVFVAYMHSRTEIRKAAWGGQTLERRAEATLGVFTNFEPFDPWDRSHALRVYERLDQNILAGQAVRHLGAGRVEYAYGDTLLQALLALVPRALWPDKPITAGSMGLASTYTGISFAKNTSVGIGAVFELFVNFGEAGVCLGFAALGALLTWLDARALARLRARDLTGLVTLYMVGAPFLLVGGSFVEVTAAAAGGLLLALAFQRSIPGRRPDRAVGRPEDRRGRAPPTVARP